MAAEDFFTRWSKKKPIDTSEAMPASSNADVADDSFAPDAVSTDVPRILPTQEDVEKLTRDSDYSVFMAQGVDESVRRSAMKKLFSDPHFNVMDGLDVYIEDFTKFEPITPAVLASLNHAKNLLDPLAQSQSPLMRLLDTVNKDEEKDNVDASVNAIEQHGTESSYDTTALSEHEGSNDPAVTDQTAEQVKQDQQEVPGENGAA